MEETRWKIVSKDGNPEKEGVYFCVLIYEEMHLRPGKSYGLKDDDWVKTGRKLAARESRWFGMADANDGWIMKDQPKEGLVWHEESGSFPNESVYAWFPELEFPRIDLPDGVEWDNG